MTRRRTAITAMVIGSVVTTALIATAAVGIGTRSDPADAAPAAHTDPKVAAGSATVDPQKLGNDFLASWVDDGRVIRRDQGSDTVSEGQAYGMLIALSVKDEKSFTSIWSWTKAHLQRSDDLLAWRYDDGAIVDDQPASDADVDTARALVLAGKAFDRPSFTKAGTAIADAVADKLTVTTDAGRILLPGLWAAATEPYAYNPSYASPVSFSVLAKATGDKRWTELEKGSAAVTSALLDKSALPSDWAQVHADGSVDAMPSPAAASTPVDPSTSVVYSYDAARLSLRYVESCTASDRQLAGRLLPALARQTKLASVLDLGGTALTTDQHPLTYASRAASEAAIGKTAAAKADLVRAAKLSASTPTYYGRAWTALAVTMLQTNLLGGCSPLGK